MLLDAGNGSKMSDRPCIDLRGIVVESGRDRRPEYAPQDRGNHRRTRATRPQDQACDAGVN